MSFLEQIHEIFHHLPVEVMQDIDKRKHVPNLKKLDGLIAEVQVRTAAQHIWAATSHVLQYKREEHVPPELRRAISRAAAVLEVVDFEFERFLNERDNLSSKNIDDQKLDIESLIDIMESMLPYENKRLGHELYATILDELFSVNIDTIGKLKNIINKHIAEVKLEDREEAKQMYLLFPEHQRNHKLVTTRYANGIHLTHTGLIRKIIRKEFGENVI
ncbi:hypothetical protein [Metabacillus fastidiosus]|uniref:hypothetical protein n=1 Tax=Metabacillus fastidiosus TaxID=1458 RepID=UPI0008257FC5|nr:hypothetical protein [Metabacillus fastidiosus]MED4462671.1 hypothetical protein [Metabacillus fastidiosus]